MSDRQTYYKDKPYFFVPFAKGVVRTKISGHKNPFNGFSGTLQITITAKTPLHFGQGELITADGVTVQHALAQENGKIALPGSGFKGMLRSVFEAVTHSCILYYPSRTEHRLDGRSPCDKQRHMDAVCPACAVFGCFGFKGKLHFSSFYAEEDAKTEIQIAPNLQSPFRPYPGNQTIGNERLYYGWFEDMQGTSVGNLSKQEFFEKRRNRARERGEFYGRKMYKHSSKTEQGNDRLGSSYECLSPGANLQGEITFEGLTREELAALLFSLGLGWERQIYHKLGYAKPAYFGSVHIDVTYKQNERYIEFCETTPDILSLAQEHRNNADESVLAAIAAIQEQWSSLGGANQWKTVEGHRNY
jgi:hypothetical protein